VTRLVLASSSRYRRALLERLGLPFESIAPEVDETALPGEAPEALAIRLAAAKAQAVRGGGTVVIGSDQVASLGGEVLRKPGTHERALEQLDRCQSRTVSFHTAVCVVRDADGHRWQWVDHTRVAFARHSRDALDAYLRREQPYDCAGGFKAEGLGIALFERIDSEDPTALIGLPLIRLAAILAEAGLDPLAR